MTAPKFQPSLQVQLDDEVFDQKAAADFLHVSESWLERSDVPRAPLSQGAGKRGPVRYLKSQLLAYVAARLSHRIDLAAQEGASR